MLMNGFSRERKRSERVDLTHYATTQNPAWANFTSARTRSRSRRARPNVLDHLGRNASRRLAAMHDVENAARAPCRAKVRPGRRTNEDVPRKQGAESVALPHARQQRREPLLPQVDVGPALRARLRV